MSAVAQLPEVEKGKNTAKYKLLVKYTSKVNRVLARADENIVQLSGDLHNAGLISEANDQEMRNPYVSKNLRAANLTGMVRGKVELSTQNFDKFMDALENYNDIFEEILEEMKKELPRTVAAEPVTTTQERVQADEGEAMEQELQNVN